MTESLQSNEILIDETERKPNMYASRVLSGIVAVIFIVWLLNEIGVFTLDKILVRICLSISIVQHIFMQYIVRKPAWIVRPWVKYAFFALVLSLVLTVTVLLNIHAVLAYVLPLLLATQYRSFRVSRIALFGSCGACFIAPILSYILNTWNLIFMTGYIQTFCHVTIDITPGNSLLFWDAVWQICLYWSLPQVMTLAAFGLILFSVTKSGIDSVKNQINVVNLNSDIAEHLNSIVSMQEKVLLSMSDIIESRDTDTGGHVRRTSEVVRLLMNAMRNDPDSGLTETFCQNVIKCAPMHDLGKISIPDNILKKRGSLTAEEFNEIKRHPKKSADIIVSALTDIEDEQLLSVATNIAKYHHERIDGTGYPEQLSGDKIPLEARIMAIADVYDALVSERCYKTPMSFEDAFDIIESSMGTQFDPALNKYFLSCRSAIESYYTDAAKKKTAVDNCLKS